jgi:hypothetical protein
MVPHTTCPLTSTRRSWRYTSRCKTSLLTFPLKVQNWPRWYHVNSTRCKRSLIASLKKGHWLQLRCSRTHHACFHASSRCGYTTSTALITTTNHWLPQQWQRPQRLIGSNSSQSTCIIINVHDTPDVAARVKRRHQRGHWWWEGGEHGESARL